MTMWRQAELVNGDRHAVVTLPDVPGLKVGARVTLKADGRANPLILVEGEWVVKWLGEPRAERFVWDGGMHGMDS